MTLYDLERRNSLYFAFFSPNSIALQADYITVVESRCSAVKIFTDNKTKLHSDDKTD